uniref:J domain-containing protein n=1 Tax=Cyanoderma ruficeps TaxID=181631 RepID=A0A8C3QTP2_9PASS
PGWHRAVPAAPRGAPGSALPPPPPPPRRSPLLPPRDFRGAPPLPGAAGREPDPFRVLGVEPTASDAELRRAYRRLAVLVHPDKSRDPRAEAAFKVLRAGWERVSSPERRRQYQA